MSTKNANLKFNTFHKEYFETKTDKNKAESLLNLTTIINQTTDWTSEFLTSDKKVSKFLPLLLADENTLNIIFDSIKTDKIKELSIFSQHVVLTRLSYEMASPTYDKFSPILLKIFDILDESKNELGSTIGFALGFCLGQAIKLGVNAEPILFLCNTHTVTEKVRFKNGFIEGINPESKLLNNSKYYISALNERYESWANSSKTLFSTILELNNPIYYHNKYFNKNIINTLKIFIDFSDDILKEIVLSTNNNETINLNTNHTNPKNENSHLELLNKIINSIEEQKISSLDIKKLIIEHFNEINNDERSIRKIKQLI